METKLRVLVVDDSALYRKIVGQALSGIPGVEVVGTAPDGKIALQKIDHLHPDLLTLDLEMPGLGGLDVLRELRQQSSAVGAIMVSAFTGQGAQATVSALQLGAFDFVLKPAGPDPAANAARLRDDLAGKIEAFARTRAIQQILRQPAVPAPAATAVAASPADDALGIADRLHRIAARPVRVRAVAIGISTGGPRALGDMLPQLPADLAAPVLIVQHMPPLFTRSLAEDLNRRCPLRVREAADQQPVVPGEILIAPGGRQMKVEEAAGGICIRITDDPPEHSCRPSVDYLFRSIAAVYGGESLGVIMTGMGNDGTQGCRLLKQKGASIIAQDAASCVVFGMPKEPIEQGIADVVAPLDKIAAEIVRLAGKRSIECK